MLLSGDLGYIDNTKLEKIKEWINEVKKMTKGIDKIIGKQTLDPLNP